MGVQHSRAESRSSQLGRLKQSLHPRLRGESSTSSLAKREQPKKISSQIESRGGSHQEIFGNEVQSASKGNLATAAISDLVRVCGFHVAVLCPSVYFPLATNIRNTISALIASDRCC